MQRDAAPHDVPGPISCVASGFCLRVDFGDAWDWGDVLSAAVSTSDDGGASWVQRSALPSIGLADLSAELPNSTSVSCGTATLCVVDEVGRHFLRTEDGGAHFGEVAVPKGGSVDAVTCLPSRTCLGVGSVSGRGALFVLTPSSATFATTSSVLPLLSDPTIACTGDARCVVAGQKSNQHGIVEATGNPGPHAHWSLLSDSPSHVVIRLACPTAARCAAVEVATASGDAYLAASHDGGKTFTATARLGGPSYPNEGLGLGLSCDAAAVCVVAWVDYAGRGTPGSAELLSSTDDGTKWSTRTLLRGDESYQLGAIGTSAACSAHTTCTVDVAANGDEEFGGIVEHTTNLSSFARLVSDDAPSSILSVACTSADTCFEVLAEPSTSAFASQLDVSHDDGTHWAPVALPAGDEPVVIGGCQSSTTCEVLGVRTADFLDGVPPLPEPSVSRTVALTTTDGGADWTGSQVGGTGTFPQEASCTSTVDCVAIVVGPASAGHSPYELATTTDGSTWSIATSPIGGLPRLSPYTEAGFAAPFSCVPGGFCLFAGFNTAAFTTDGGTSLSTATLPVADAYPAAVSCTAASDCAMLFSPSGGGSALEFSRTSNAGSTWTAPKALAAGVGTDVSAQLDCPSTLDCVVVLDAALSAPQTWSTTDGGTTWTRGTWLGGSITKSDAGILLFGALSCSPTVCMTIAQAALFDATGAYVEVDRALQ